MPTQRPEPEEAARDEAQLRLVAEGDRAAFAALYDRFAPSMLGLANRILGSPREAEDVLHDVFLEAWHRARYYDPERGSVRTWLMLRLRSRALDRLRGVKRMRNLVKVEERSARATSVSEQGPAAGVDAARLRGLVETLPLEQRTVLELGYFEGRTYVEIAEQLDIPVGTVKSRMARAIALLRDGMRSKAEAER